jgi:Uncharacterized protein conserved in bacteria
MKKMLENKKITFTVIAVIILCLIVGLTMILKKDTNNNKLENNNAPATNTKELKKKLKNVEAEIVNSDKIEFNKLPVEKGEKVAIWVYSEPKFLGFFEIKEKDGKTYIEGLDKALKNINITSGNHNIAIVTKDNKPIGYINIYITDKGKIKDTVTEKNDTKTKDKNGEEEKEEIKEDEKTTEKTIIENETIPFTSKTENEVNMLRGATKITQAGISGSKKVTYKVTYDSKKKEISRTKVTEKVTKKPTEQITKIGISDYNINTDKILGMFAGLTCTETMFYQPGNFEGCDETITNPKFFTAITLKNGSFVHYVGNSDVDGIVNIKPMNKINGKRFYYNGSSYFADIRRGDDTPVALTSALCTKHGLACGQW